MLKENTLCLNLYLLKMINAKNSGSGLLAEKKLGAQAEPGCVGGSQEDFWPF